MSDSKPSSPAQPAPSAGRLDSYLRILRTNSRFRRFWLATIVSQLGDWFNYIAIFVLLTELTGSGEAVSWFLIAKFLPTTLLGPIAGVVADRFNRKRIMVCCDLLRALVVAGYLLVGVSGQVWLVYLLAFLQEGVWSFNHPARQASIPDICTREELNVANGLFGASWSVNLALGAALGGFVTAWFGWRAAILVDVVTFMGSALLIALVPLEHVSAAVKGGGFSLARISGLADIIEGLHYVRSHPRVAALLLVKSGWALSGGILVMLTVFGEQVFSQSGQGGLSGALYSMRGLGAAVGPFLAWRWFGNEPQGMRRAIGAAFYISALSYLCFSQAPNILVAGCFVLLGHIGGSIQWVFSTALLHHRVEARFRGRVFAVEMALLTLTLCLSTLATGQALDAGLGPRTIVVVLALLFLLPGTIWLYYLRRLGSMEGDGPKES
ncbi:MFS transporter [Desulfogranum mediterraneum]|uniref:MFS transporter n=1 Tax=Desulfogranum mediterraneum TaxID=160661 RepID=UPI0003FA185A|nr:MFS transporter [Desulfogranum mediterraneum]